MGAASIRLPQRLRVKLREKAEETDSLPGELGVELLCKGLNANALHINFYENEMDIAALEILSGRIEELMDNLSGILCKYARK